MVSQRILLEMAAAKQQDWTTAAEKARDAAFAVFVSATARAKLKDPERAARMVTCLIDGFLFQALEERVGADHSNTENLEDVERMVRMALQGLTVSDVSHTLWPTKTPGAVHYSVPDLSLTFPPVRASVKTPPLKNFGGRLTLGEVEKIAPSAIWRLDISSHSTRSVFSHSLGREQAFGEGGYRPQAGARPRGVISSSETESSQC